MKISYIVFDIGGVIVTDGPSMATVAEVLDIPLGGDSSATLRRIHDAVWKHRDDYDMGLDDTSYWERICGTLDVPPPNKSALARLVDNDVKRWSSPQSSVVTLIHKLVDSGYQCCILSNAPTALANSFRSQQWVQECFVHCFFSCETLLAKPASSAYQNMIDKLECDAQQIVFVDDRQTNVAAARALGIDGRVWQGNATLIDLLSSTHVPETEGTL